MGYEERKFGNGICWAEGLAGDCERAGANISGLRMSVSRTAFHHINNNCLRTPFSRALLWVAFEIRTFHITLCIEG